MHVQNQSVTSPTSGRQGLPLGRAHSATGRHTFLLRMFRGQPDKVPLGVGVLLAVGDLVAVGVLLAGGDLLGAALGGGVPSETVSDRSDL